MFGNKVFRITFFVSIFAHGLIMLFNPNLNLFSPNKQEQKVEVSYVKTTPLTPVEQNIKKEPFLKLPSKITIREKLPPPPFMDKEAIFNINKDHAARGITFAKPVLIKPDIIPIKKKITLPPIDMDKINNPSYITYYQIVREKIRRAAYQNYTRTETGEVYLTFIISSDGYLKELRLTEEKSSPSSYLREVALKSLKDASPFPNFPKELEYPQLSFNVIISFEIE